MAGIIDAINDPSSDTQDAKTASFPELTSESRAADYDSDKDGIPDAWEIANGLNPNDASDAQLKTLDTEKGWYTNLEVYLNSIVEPIVKAQNADPAFKTAAINTPMQQSEVKTIEYYTVNGQKLAAPQRGINIRKMVMTNGQTVCDKVIKE